jgi:hypothetical protein
MISHSELMQAVQKGDPVAKSFLSYALENGDHKFAEACLRTFLTPEKTLGDVLRDKLNPPKNGGVRESIDYQNYRLEFPKQYKILEDYSDYFTLDFNGNKVSAIKALRQTFGYGLKEAKDITDAYEGGSLTTLHNLITRAGG